MKICLVFVFACATASPPALVNKRKRLKEIYCAALNKDSVLFSGSSDHDPMKNCGGKCQPGKLKKLWLPQELKTRFYDVMVYYNLYMLQSWLIRQIKTKGCLQLNENSATKGCKLPCTVMESAKEEIYNLMKPFDDIYFSKVKPQKKRLQKMGKKTKKVLGKRWKKFFNWKRFEKKVKRVVRKTSSCVLHTEVVADKLTSPCNN